MNGFGEERLPHHEMRQTFQKRRPRRGDGDGRTDGRRRHHSAFGMSIDARVGVALWENVADFSTPPLIERTDDKEHQNRAHYADSLFPSWMDVWIA